MTKQPTFGDSFLTRVNQIIEDNLDNEHFSVEELADKVGISRSMLHRKLIKETGKSATSLITEFRLARAKMLLETDEVTSSEIAYLVGFNSPSYFNKVFKKRYGRSPGIFRKMSEQEAELPQAGPKSLKKHRSLIWGIVAAFVVSTVILFIAVKYFATRERDILPKSIAILPFDNLSNNNENQYIVDGLVDELIGRLSIIPDLKVISRTSTEIFRDKKDNTIPEIARILDVSHIIEGSVQREGNQIKVSIQLIDAKSDGYLLSKQYERELDEVFHIQAEIVNEITRELSLVLSDRQIAHLQIKPTDNMEAFNYYQIGRHNYCRCTKEEVYASIDYYKKAIEADSMYAPAYAGLAASYVYLASSIWIEDVENGRDSAVAMAGKALEIDDNLAEAHAALGIVYFLIDYNMEAAEQEFQKAIRINPNSAESLKEYAKLLSFNGRLKEARNYMNQAIVLAPVTFNIRRISTLLYIQEGKFDKALEENQRSLELEKDHPFSLNLGFYINLGLGNDTAAYKSFRKLAEVSGEYDVHSVDSAYQISNVEGLFKMKMKKYKDEFLKAEYFAWLGDSEKALDLLELAFEKEKLDPFALNWLLIFDRDLQNHPRYQALKRKLELKIH